MTPLRRSGLVGWTICIALAAGIASAGAQVEVEFGADDLIKQAREFLATGRNVEAIDALKKALGKRPFDAAARLLASRAYLRIGNGAAAEREATRAANSRGVPSLVIPALGRALLLQGKYDDLLLRIRPVRLPAKAAAEALFLRGQAHFARIEYSFARAEFERALARDPGHHEARLGLARLALSQGRLDEAKELANSALASDEDDPDAWYVKAESLRRTDALAPALKAYGRAIRIADRHIPARVARAALLIAHDRIEEALADLDLVREVVPGDPQAGILRALALARTGRSDEARSALLKAAATVDHMDSRALSKHPPSILLAALVRYATGEYEHSIQLFRRYLGLVPDHVRARKVYGAILFRRNDHRAAVQALIRVAPEMTEDLEVFVDLGGAHLGRKSYHEAANAFAVAASLAPGDARIRTLLALSRLGAGERELGTAELSKAYDLSDHEWRTGLMLGLLQIESGKPEAAVKTGRSLRMADPNDPLPVNLEGVARFRAGHGRAARSRFEAALQRDPGHVPALYNLASLDLGSGDLISARRRYVAVLKTAPDEVAAMMALARLAEANGRLEEALRWLAKAAKAAPRTPSPGIARTELLLRYGRFAEALATATALAAGNSRDGRVLELLARSQLAAQDVDEARITYRQLTTTVASSIQQLVRIARAQERIGDLDGAVFSMESAQSIEAGNEAIAEAIIELEVAKRSPRAAEAYLGGITNTPGMTAIVANARASMLSRRGKFNAAAKAYGRVLAMRPHRRTVLRLYDALVRAGRKGAALAVLKRWMARRPGDGIVGRFRAARLVEQGEPKTARAVLGALAARHPNDPEILNDLAILSFRLKDPKARTIAEAALLHAPGRAAVLDTLGWILVQTGEVEAGLVRLRVAAVKAPGDPRVGFHRAVALQRMGLDELARRFVEHALAAKRRFAERPDAVRLKVRLAGG